MDHPLTGTIEEASWKALGLSRREVQVVSLVVRGLKDREIAVQLGITEATVKVHLRRIYRKLKCRNRTELAVRLVTYDGKPEKHA